MLAELRDEITDARQLVAHTALDLLEPSVGDFVAGGEVLMTGGQSGVELLAIEDSGLSQGLLNGHIALGRCLLTEESDGPRQRRIGVGIRALACRKEQHRGDTRRHAAEHGDQDQDHDLHGRRRYAGGVTEFGMVAAATGGRPRQRWVRIGAWVPIHPPGGSFRTH